MSSFKYILAGVALAVLIAACGSRKDDGHSYGKANASYGKAAERAAAPTPTVGPDSYGKA